AAREIVDLVKFCLASLLLGAAIGGVAMLPIFRDYYVHFPLSFVISKGAPDFHLFELGAAGCITLLGVFAALRRGSANPAGSIPYVSRRRHDAGRRRISNTQHRHGFLIYIHIPRLAGRRDYRYLLCIPDA